jgi:hypothetical protein
MPEILDTVTELFVQMLVLVVGTLLALLANKAKLVLDGLRKKDEMGIIDLVTDRVAEYAQAELKGEPGKQKRDFAVARAIEILESKGIKVNEQEVIAGIENGVTKLRMNDQFMTPFQGEIHKF